MRRTYTMDKVINTKLIIKMLSKVIKILKKEYVDPKKKEKKL